MDIVFRNISFLPLAASLSDLISELVSIISKKDFQRNGKDVYVFWRRLDYCVYSYYFLSLVIVAL